MSRIMSIVLSAVVVAACGGGQPAADLTSTMPTEQTTTSTQLPVTTASPPLDAISVGDLGVIVPPDSDGNYPRDLVVSCGNGHFPVGALEEIVPLDAADPGGVAEAIAPFLANEEGQHWPQDGWQILHQSDDEIQLVAKKEDGLLAFMYVSHDGEDWTWAGGSLKGDACQLEFTVADDLNAVEWRPDPSAPALTPGSTDIAVILNERECVGGQEIGDRLLDPEIVMTESRVFIAFAAERPPGDAFDCPGNPDTPFVVELPEPIGERELAEGLRIGINLGDYVD